MKKLAQLLLIYSLLLIPVLTLAESGVHNTGSGSGVQNSGGGNPSFTINIPNPLKNDTNNLPALLNLLIDNIIFPLGSIVVVIMIIYAGFQFVTAQGNETKLATAKKSLLYAAIGAAILLGARAISTVIQGTVTQLTS